MFKLLILSTRDGFSANEIRVEVRKEQELVQLCSSELRIIKTLAGKVDDQLAQAIIALLLLKLEGELIAR